MEKSQKEHEPAWVGSMIEDVVTPRSAVWSFAEGQRIWLLLQSRAWQTLAIVPVDTGVATDEVASRIVALGQEQGERIGLADLREVQLNRVPAFLDVTRLLVSRGRRVVCAMRSIEDNLATIPLARASDGVILCVTLGATSIAGAEAAIAQIGKERLVGSMLFHPSARARRPSARAIAPLLVEVRP